MPWVPYEIKSFSDVEKLVANEIPESLYLDYKSGRPVNGDSFKNDLAKDVSAFANSDGGTIIVGVAEENNKPARIDGVDDSKLKREALDQIIHAHVSPRIPGLRIERVQNADNTLAVFVITIPASKEPPHQGPGKVYYRRHEFTNQPLAHFEIEDLRRRRLAYQPLVALTGGKRGSFLATVEVRNPGTLPAQDIRFTFPEEMPWPEGGIPNPLKSGISFLGPGQVLSFRYMPFVGLFSPSLRAVFAGQVEYSHPLLQERVSEEWYIDFEAYRDSMGVTSDRDQWERDILREFKRIADGQEKLTKCLERTLPKLAGANGLDLSVWTLHSLKRIASAGTLPKVSPHLGWQFFQDALAIDPELAFLLEGLVRQKAATREAVASLPDMTPDILARIAEIFDFQWKPEGSADD